MEIGEEIRRIRYVEVKTTQERLAAAVGISAHHLRMIECGERKPSIGLLIRLASAMGYNIRLVKK